MCLNKILLEENASDYIQKSACFSMELNVLVHKYEKFTFILPFPYPGFHLNLGFPMSLKLFNVVLIRSPH